MAGSPFDMLQKTVFNTVESVFGYQAFWTPSNGGPILQATVLFNSPTDNAQLAGPAEYMEPHWSIEYASDQFVGLKELLDIANTLEVITIDDIEYHARNAITLFDGKTVKVTITPKGDD